MKSIKLKAKEENILNAKEMKLIKHSVQVNMLLILFGSFAEKIKPTPVNCMNALHLLIPRIAETKVEQLSKYCSESLIQLRQDPSDVHKFVSQFEFRKKIQNEFPSIQSKSKDYTAFYTLMSSLCVL